MSYLVFCTFDLENASTQDYQNAYADLASLHLEKVQKANDGSIAVIPTTSAMGTFTGTNAAGVRDDACNRVQAAFRARKFKSEIFVTVGGDWAWGGRTT